MSKIVVFDSGFGGLTVLNELQKVMPDGEYIYFGDSANAPYGDKSHDELLELDSAICSRVLSQYDVRCFVIACNTTTSEVWDDLTGRFPAYDFVGIEPALKWAVEENPGRNILVLATTATINGKRLRARCAELKDRAHIELAAAPGIVPFVESCSAGSDEFAAYLKELLAPYRDSVDCVVLGCTHFPFVKNEIREAIGHDVLFYDAAVSVAEEVRELLESGCSHGRTPVYRGLPQGTGSSGSARDPYADAARGTQCPGANDGAASVRAGNVIYMNSDPDKVELEAKLLEIYRSIRA